MPLYVFHLFKVTGPSDAFEAEELPGDLEAMGYAFAVLEGHPSAAYVEVWCDGRRVLTRPRINGALREVLTQGPAPS